MAVTLDELKAWARALGVPYLVDPGAPNLIVSEEAGDETLQYAITIQDEGTFLQLRSIDLARVGETAVNLSSVLNLIAVANGHYRAIKFGRNAASGEVTVSAELWALDMELTKDAFMRLHLAFLQALREFHGYVEQAVKSGVVPDLDPVPDVTHI